MGEQAVRGGDQNWSLLPFVAMMTVKTGYHAGGENGGFLGGYPEFSTWLGKNSSRGKTNRLLGELGYHMNYKVSTDKADLRLYYLPLVCERILKLLTDSNNDGKSNIVEAIDLMDDYGLDRDDVFDNLDEFALDPKAKKFGDLDSKIKAAFTREYNQRAHKSQALVAEQGAGKISRKSIGSKMSSKDPSDLDAVDDDGAEESDDDEEEMTEQQLKELFSKKKRKSTGGKKTKESGGKKS
jgi:replication factor C subunit 1